MPPEVPAAFSAALYRHRMVRGWSLQQAARAAGVSVMTVDALLAGPGDPAAAVKAVLELADEWDAVDPGHPCAAMVRAAVPPSLAAALRTEGRT